MKRLLDWIFTLPFLFAFGALLGVFDPLQRLALLLGQRPQEVVVAILQWCLAQALRLCGTGFEVERAPGVSARGPQVLIANHQSMFDIPILASLLPWSYCKYIAKKELARGIPSISFNLRRGGNAIIDRGDREQAVAAIRELGARAQSRGVSVLIYPEGTRARDGRLKEFKPAGTLALLAAAPALPVVPVTIDGSWLLVSRGLLPVPFGTRVRVRLGEPIPRGAATDEELMRQAEREIRGTLARWRGEAAAAAP